MASCRAAPATAATTTCKRSAFREVYSGQEWRGAIPAFFASEKSSLHLKLDRPDMPRVADLRMVERGDVHGHAARDRDVVLTSGIEAPRDLECPATGGPARDATNVGPIATVLAHDEDTGNEGVERKLRVGLRRVRDRLGFRHPPARALVLPDVGIEIDPAHGGPGRLPILRQPLRLHRVLIAAGTARLEVVRVVCRTRIGGIAAFVRALPCDLVSARLGRRAEMAVVDEAQVAAAGRLPLPEVNEAAVHRVVQPTPGERGRLAIERRASGVKGSIAGEQGRVLAEQNRELVLVIVVLVAAVVVAL